MCVCVCVCVSSVNFKTGAHRRFPQRLRHLATLRVAFSRLAESCGKNIILPIVISRTCNFSCKNKLSTFPIQIILCISKINSTLYLIKIKLLQELVYRFNYVNPPKQLQTISELHFLFHAYYMASLIRKTQYMWTAHASRKLSICGCKFVPEMDCKYLPTPPNLTKQWSIISRLFATSVTCQ